MKRLPEAPKHRQHAAHRPILYIEDNDDNWRTAELRLGSKFSIFRARSDREACALLRDPRRTFVAILADIELQGSELTGIDLVRLMRGRSIGRPVPDFGQAMPCFDTPVIFITAYGDAYSETLLRAAGGDRVMTKPVDFKQLNMVLMNLYVNRAFPTSG